MTKAYIVRNNGTSKLIYHTARDCQYIRSRDTRKTTVRQAESEGKHKCMECADKKTYGTVGGGISRLERILREQDEDVAVSD